MKEVAKKLLVMLIAVLLLSAGVMTAEAAEGKAGQTVSVSFQFNDIRGIDGSFEFTNKEMFSSISYNSTFSGARFNNDKVFYSTTEAGTSSGSITVTCVIAANAAPGSTCVITMSNINLTDGNTNSVKGGTRSERITVTGGGEQIDTGTQNTTDEIVDNQPSNGSVKKNNSQTGTSQTTAPDKTKLQEQIAAASGFSKAGYTKSSWDALVQALANGKSALSSASQQTIDAAALTLEAAKNSLVKMDYSGLQKAMDEANQFTENQRVATLFNQLSVAVSNGALLLESDDQTTVDAAKQEINDLLTQIRAELATDEGQEAANTGVVNDYVAADKKDCTRVMHKIWPLLFFISLAVNVILLILLHPGIRRRLQKNGDDIPMMDYDIDDDETWESSTDVEDIEDFEDEEDFKHPDSDRTHTSDLEEYLEENLTSIHTEWDSNIENL